MTSDLQTNRESAPRAALSDYADGSTGQDPSILLLGGGVSTGNLGVSALGIATVKGILRELPDARIVLQNRGDEETVTICLGERRVTLPTTWLHYGRALRQRAGTRHLRFLTALHRRLPPPFKQWLRSTNRTFAQLNSVEAALALNGGDSFSDIYSGSHVLDFMAALKLLLARRGTPLILLPQTIGPFRGHQARELAREVLDYCSLVATREAGGLEELETMFGGWLPSRAVACPDVAFTLDAVPVDRDREPFVSTQVEDRRLIGLNVSGLLYLSERQFGLKDQYPRLVRAIADWALSRPERRLLLVPHVISHTPPDRDGLVYDSRFDTSDTLACQLLRRDLVERYGERVGSLGWSYTESETKYLIGQCDFMIGARMHACIAAISQAVPTVTLAYSKKAQGVMGFVGDQAPVLDLRLSSVSEMLELIDRWYEQRTDVRAALLERIPGIKARVEQFFNQCLCPVVEDLVRVGRPCSSRDGSQTS